MTTTINADTSIGIKITSDTSGVMGLQTAGNTAITIDGSQNVGVGVTPVSQNGKVFHIDGGAGATDIRLTNNATGSARDNGTLFTLYGSDAYLWNLENNFLSFGTNNLERMRIGASGNVGIGTSSPVSPLNISDGAAMYGAGTGEMIQLRRTPANGNDSTSFVGMGFGNASNAFKIGYGGATDRFRFIDGGAIEVLSLVNGGNVGISCISPQANFQIGSADGASRDIVIHTANNGNARLRFREGATISSGYNEYSFGMAGSTNGLTFECQGYGEVSRFDSGGNFLVGVTSASYHTLAKDIAGNFATEIRNSNANPYGLYLRFSGAAPNGSVNEFLYCGDTVGQKMSIRSNGGIANYSASNFNLASDLRLKHNIEPVKSYWEVFKAIEWKTWLYNDQTDEIKNIGVIAQELQTLAPEFVCESNLKETPEGELPYLGLWENDLKMAGMSVITELVKRCEQQQAIITQLQADVAALKGA
jgi:hypothetical protein